jgi:transglutaminase-like putative cysteine protease/predicted glutamine amidotransferase
MPNLLAMSFEGDLAPSFDLRCLHPGQKPPDGWGIGFYPGGELAASVLKEPAPQEGSIRSVLVNAWDHLASSIFLLQIRHAKWGHISDSNTQPFSRTWGRRDWLFAHAGSLRQRLKPSEKPIFEPVGSTDSEAIFCELLGRVAAAGWQSLGEADVQTLYQWFDEFNGLGDLTAVLTDGHDLCVYADRRAEASRIEIWPIVPPHDRIAFGDADLEVDLTRRGIKARKGVIVTSGALKATSNVTPDWRSLPPGHLVIIRQGAVWAEAGPPPVDEEHATIPQIVVDRRTLPTKGDVQQLYVRHRTTYRYASAVERSSHVLRLAPAHDRLQSVLDHDVKLSVDGQQREYEDVFGNFVRSVSIDTPYEELTIEARSLVELWDINPLNFRALRARTTIPLVWMPWQRHMLQPYLLPPELPDSELHELVEYAMTFVRRNDYDILDTLLDLNMTIFKEYAYQQGMTTVSTTPFEVYANRRGVCQDFTNLFICLCRLLGVPARYVCGYLYTGPKNPNQRQGEASHAWSQVYLPEVGWKGFDPTNGVLTQTNHIRVAIGRNYVDATPTSGTIYVGGGHETLEVDVRVAPFMEWKEEP